MPFGLKNAGATYQRLMNKVFEKQLGRNVEVYVDDILGKSKEVADFIVDLEETFATLIYYGIKFNPAKCIFGVKSGKFSCFIVTDRGIEVNPEKSQDEKCEQTFQDLKVHLADLPVLVKPEPGEKLFVYLSTTEYAVSSVKIKEEGSDQKPVYYVSHALRGPELRYNEVEKIALALVMTVRKLRPYFLSHQIIMLTNSPLGRIMTHSKVSGWMIKWTVELGEYDIKYKRRVAIKAQALSDFLSELVQLDEELWRVFVDGASSLAGCEVGVVIISPLGEKIKLALRIDSRVTNNEAEYEIVLAGIRAAREVGASRIILYSDSQLITHQIKGVYEAKDDRMLKYLQLIKAQSEVFVDWSIEQIPREENNEADALAKMADSLSEVNTREVLHVSQLVLSAEEETLPAPEDSWMASLIKFIINNELPEDKARAQKIKRQAPRFVFLNIVLYRRSFQGPLLKCLFEGEVDYVLREIHEGAVLSISEEYLWPGRQCLLDSGGQLLAKTLLEWSGLWDIDIVGPFPIARVQKKFLLVAVDYFSKWVEAEPLAKITEQEVLKFLWKNVLCRCKANEKTGWKNYPVFSWHTELLLRAPTQETPFNLVYGSEAVLPVEIGQTSSRIESYPENNDQSRAMELDLVEEKRDRALIRMEAYRGRVMKSYNKKVRIRDFQIGDLVMKKLIQQEMWGSWKLSGKDLTK
ncbi:uncharacterized protein LOC142519769 [Primulina tabacum]|uniref:uncharacterized protein LOC142519769 n=1 Tax=Primulina tabacum TaxID=48773 RepID=UPI003F5A16D7